MIRWLAAAFAAYLVLSYGAGRAAIWWVNRRGDPDGWRFNHVGANAVLGHLSFYEDSPGWSVASGRAVVWSQSPWVPVIWTVKHTAEPGAYNDMVTVMSGPVWSVLPRSYRIMDDGGQGQQPGRPAEVYAATPDGERVQGYVTDPHGQQVFIPVEDRDREGMVCMFCGADGFQSQDALEDHIDSHPYTTRREDANH